MFWYQVSCSLHDGQNERRGKIGARAAGIVAAEIDGFAQLGQAVGKSASALADDLPVIGPSAVMPNLIYATGHYRNGVLLAPLTAQLVADAMLEDRIDPMLSAVSPSRFGYL